MAHMVGALKSFADEQISASTLTSPRFTSAHIMAWSPTSSAEMAMSESIIRLTGGTGVCSWENAGIAENSSKQTSAPLDSNRFIEVSFRLETGVFQIRQQLS